MNYEELVEKLAGEILEDVSEEEMEVEAGEDFDMDNYMLEKTAAKKQLLLGAGKAPSKIVGAAKRYGRDVSGKTLGKAKEIQQGAKDTFELGKKQGLNHRDLAELSNRKRQAAKGVQEAGRRTRNARIGTGAAVAGAGGGAHAYNKHQEKAASYYDEAQLIKQAAEEAYLEAQALEEASMEVLAELGYEFE